MNVRFRIVAFCDVENLGICVWIRKVKSKCLSDEDEKLIKVVVGWNLKKLDQEYTFECAKRKLNDILI